MDTTLILKEQITALLVQAGFTRSPNSPGVVEKRYACGIEENVAIVCLNRLCRKTGEISLNAYFFNNGRNILQWCAQLVSDDAGPAMCGAQVRRFVNAIEREISNSSSVRVNTTSARHQQAVDSRI